ncbi:MAG: inovirus-type Gp2 protein [Pseudomonadota bacterium]
MNTFTYNPNYQSRIATTVDKALQSHNRVTAIRVDLRLPNNFGGLDMSSSIMTRFVESLKAKIAADLRRKEQAWGRKLLCSLKDVWVREVGPINGKKHFHVLLLMNKDVYHSLGDFNATSGNLSESHRVLRRL